MFTPILKSVELGSIISSSSGSSFSSISSISSIASIAHHSHRDMNLDMDLDTRFDMNLDTNLDNILSQTQSLVERHPLAPLPPEVGSYRVIFLTRPYQCRNEKMPSRQPQLLFHEILYLREPLVGLLAFFSFWYRTGEGQLKDHPVSVI